jgi:hypothetical protein
VLPFHCTTEVPTKFAPLTVKVKAVPPTLPLKGETVLIDGCAFGDGVGVGVGVGIGVGEVVGPEEPPHPQAAKPMAIAITISRLLKTKRRTA